MERAAPKPRPKNAIELYKRMVSMLHLERPRGSILDRREGPPTELVIRRDLVPLFKESRKIDSIFAVINAAEEAPGEIRINAYVPAQSHTYSLLVDEDTIATLAAESSGAERKALESGAGDQVVGPIVDRLKFHWRRGGTSQAALEMGLRMKGIGGRKIMSRGLRINGMHHVVTLFERAGELRVEVYMPLLSRRVLFRFSPRERLELLGSTNWGEKSKWIAEVCRRLSLKGPVKNPRKQELRFDRTLHSQASRVGSTYMTLTFSLPDPVSLVSDEEAATGGGGGAHRAGGTGTPPTAEVGLRLRAYNNRTSSEYALRLTDDDVRALLEVHRLKQAGKSSRHIDKSKLASANKERENPEEEQNPHQQRRLQWPCRGHEERVMVLQIIVGLLHWGDDREPRLSKDPLLAVGEPHAPLRSSTRVLAGGTSRGTLGGVGGAAGATNARTGRQVTSTLKDETQVDFADAGPLVFDGEQGVGLRKFHLTIREVQTSKGKRHALRMLGKDKGGTEYTAEFLETELVDKLGLLPKSKTPTDAAVPKLLQRLKCRQGTFVLEARGKSRGSTAGTTRGGTAGGSRGGTGSAGTAGSAGGKKTPGGSGAQGGDPMSRIAAQFRHAETVELDGASMEAAGAGLFDISEMDPIGQSDADFDLVYRKGFKITPEQQRQLPEDETQRNPPDRMFYVVEVYIADPDKERWAEQQAAAAAAAQGGEQKKSSGGSAAVVENRFSDFGTAGIGDRRKIRLSLYNPLTSYRVGITLERARLEEVCAKHAEMMERGREMEMIDYLLYDRLRLMPPMSGPPGVDTIEGKGDIVHERLTTQLEAPEGQPAPPFRLELLRARVFGSNKVTPLQLSGVQDAMANRGASVLIKQEDDADDIAPYAGRGLKLFNLAHRMPSMPTPDMPRGELVFVMCTAFDMSPEAMARAAGRAAKVDTKEDDGEGSMVIETKTMGAVRLPRMRILAYEPNSSHKMQLMIGGGEMLEAISSNGVVDEELLAESRRELLAKHLIKCLRLQRKRNAPPVLRLLSLTETLKDERRREAEEDAQKRLEEVAARKAKNMQERKNSQEEVDQRQRLLSSVSTDDGQGPSESTSAAIALLEQEEANKEQWIRAADFVNKHWKEGVEIDGHSLVISAAAVQKSSIPGIGNRNELWSSESELDFSDQEIDPSRSELRLQITVYSPELAETATATVPTIVISQLLGAPLEHLDMPSLEGGLATLMQFADIRVRDDDATALFKQREAEEQGTAVTSARDVDKKRQAEENKRMRGMLSGAAQQKERSVSASTASTDGFEEGIPASLEPRLTFAIDPQLPPRKRKEMDFSAGEVKISSSPGMPTVSTVGEQIFHRAMKIEGDLDTEEIPHHYLLMRIFSGVGSRGRSFRIEAYNPKLSHSAQVTLSEPRFTRLIAGRSEMLLPGDGRADFLAMVIQEALIVKNAIILAHMRLIIRRYVQSISSCPV